MKQLATIVAVLVLATWSVAHGNDWLHGLRSLP